MPSAAWRNADAAARERKRRELRSVESGGGYSLISSSPEWDAFFGSIADQRDAANAAGLDYRVNLGGIGRDGYEGMDPAGRPNRGFLAQTLASEDISRRLQAQNAERDAFNKQAQQANLNDLMSMYIDHVQASDMAPPVQPHNTRRFEVAPVAADPKAPGLAGMAIGQPAPGNRYEMRPTSQSRRDMVLNALGRGDHPARAAYLKQFAAEDLASRKMAVDEAKANQETTAAVPMTDDAVDYAAAQVRILGNGANVLTRLDDDDRKKILNRVAEQTKTLGQTPAQAIQKQYAFKSDAKSLDLIQKLSSTAEAAEQKALGQADIIAELSEKVSRTRWPIINAALQAGKTEIAGDPDATRLANAITTFASEYGKIIEGSTGSVAGSSDSARRASDKLIAAKMSDKQLAGVLDLMKREMAMTLQGYDVTRSRITERMGGGAPPPDTDVVSPPPGPGRGGPSAQPTGNPFRR